MKMNQQLQQSPSRDTLQAYARNRANARPEDLQQYAGKFVAWSPDATRVLASHDNRQGLRKLLLEMGQPPHQCVIERIPLGKPPGPAKANS
jgi:hypothetical protein